MFASVQAVAVALFSLTSPVAVEAVIAVPPGGDARALAEELCSAEFVKRSLDQAFALATYRTPEELSRRLRAEPAGDGKTVRLVLTGRAEAEAVEGLHAVVQGHLYDRVPMRKELVDLALKELAKRAKEPPRTYYPLGGEPYTDDRGPFTDKHRKMLREYFRAFDPKGEDAVVVHRPRPVR